jgi:hypothetical protein
LKEMLTAKPDGSAWLRAANHGGGKAGVTRRDQDAKNHRTEIIEFFS